MASSIEKWVIVYGFGTSSAYVDRVAKSREHAAGLLRAYAESWGPYSDRFTAHPYEQVVSRATTKDFVLKKHVRGTQSVRAPESARRNPRESVSFIRKAS